MRNDNFMRKHLLSMLSIIGILVITVTITGIAWSRFREEDVKIMQIETYHQRKWYMFGRLETPGEVTAERIVTEAGSLPGVIEQDNLNKKISFYITNGPEAGKFAKEDLTYSMEVLVTNTLNPTDLVLMLRYKDEATEEQKAIIATPFRIGPEDPLYKSIGDGYVYKFFVDKPVTSVNGDGTTVTTYEKAEFTAVLPGKSLNYHGYDLQIVGQPEAGLLEIEVIEITQAQN